MNQLNKHKSLRSILRGLFASSPNLIVEQSKDTRPQGVCRTLFEDNIVHYSTPVQPREVMDMDALLNRFGRSQPVNFKRLTLASQNTFKS